MFFENIKGWDVIKMFNKFFRRSRLLNIYIARDFKCSRLLTYLFFFVLRIFTFTCKAAGGRGGAEFWYTLKAAGTIGWRGNILQHVAFAIWAHLGSSFLFSSFSRGGALMREGL